MPSDQCKDVNPENYGIITNDKHKFIGEKIVIFYSFGAYPYCEMDTRMNQMSGLFEKISDDISNEDSSCFNPVNGGVPQVS